MVNPVYALNTISEVPDSGPLNSGLKTPKLTAQKHHAKIDANLRINNLTQEVNMPLLRLAHQLYSIIADAIDYDKEHNKLMTIATATSLPPDQADEQRDSLSQLPSILRRGNSHRNNLSPASRRDCWRFMDDLIENGQKVTVETELKPKKSTPKTSLSLASAKDSAATSGLVLTIFASTYIKKIKSRAALGTLAFNGEMNNFQVSLTFVQKYLTPLARSSCIYEGSLNTCVDSTHCNLTENDTKKSVVLMRVARCHLFSYLKKFQVQNSVSSFVHIGQINIDVPLRPMLVHGVVYRESKVIEQNILPEIKNFVIFETDTEAATAASTAKSDMNDTITSEVASGVQSEGNQTLKAAAALSQTTDHSNASTLTRTAAGTLRQNGGLDSLPSVGSRRRNTSKYVLVSKEKPCEVYTLDFKSKFDGCEVRAKLLETPCLKASYLIRNVEVNTLVTGEATKVTFFLDRHCLSFQCDDEVLTERRNGASFRKSKEKNLSCNSLSFGSGGGKSGEKSGGSEADNVEYHGKFLR